MRLLSATGLLTAGMVVGCMAGGPVTTARTPGPTPASAPAEPTGESHGLAGRGTECAPLLLDRNDTGFGLTVQMSRLPTPVEIEDLRQTRGLAHVVITLSEWPPDYESLMPLGSLPLEADVTVLLTGYPPSRQAAQAWDLVQAPVRLVLLLQDPPPSPTVVTDINAMRGLERVILETERPSRAGFERLQRPLSFRWVME